MTSSIRPGARLLFIVLTVVVAAAAIADIAWASRTRCALAGSEPSVLSLSDLDVLHAPYAFRLSQPAEWSKSVPLRLEHSFVVNLTGTMNVAGSTRDFAVLLTVDARVSRGSMQSGSFSVELPVSQLNPGRHDVSLAFVTGDLTGYYQPIRDWPIVVDR